MFLSEKHLPRVRGAPNPGFRRVFSGGTESGGSSPQIGGEKNFPSSRGEEAAPAGRFFSAFCPWFSGREEALPPLFPCPACRRRGGGHRRRSQARPRRADKPHPPGRAFRRRRGSGAWAQVWAAQAAAGHPKENAASRRPLSAFPSGPRAADFRRPKGPAVRSGRGADSAAPAR